MATSKIKPITDFNHAVDCTNIATIDALFDALQKSDNGMGIGEIGAYDNPPLRAVVGNPWYGGTTYNYITAFLRLISVSGKGALLEVIAFPDYTADQRRTRYWRKEPSGTLFASDWR